MGVLIKEFKDGSKLEYSTGRFDDWCVYLTRPNKKRYPPRDVEYFQELVNLAEIYGADKLYKDFVRVYNKVNSKLEETVCLFISTIAKGYVDHVDDVDVVFSVLYAAMVAEENKVYAILKKRIKRLGVHQILIEGLGPAEAAVFSKGKKARDLINECLIRGF